MDRLLSWIDIVLDPVLEYSRTITLIGLFVRPGHDDIVTSVPNWTFNPISVLRTRKGVRNLPIS